MMDKADKNALWWAGMALKLGILVEHCQDKHVRPHKLCAYCGLDKLTAWWKKYQEDR